MRYARRKEHRTTWRRSRADAFIACGELWRWVEKEIRGELIGGEVGVEDYLRLGERCRDVG